MNTPDYLEPLLAEVKRRRILLVPGREYHVQILHDDWCDLQNGRGPCNCNPVIGEVSREPPSGTR